MDFPLLLQNNSGLPYFAFYLIFQILIVLKNTFNLSQSNLLTSHCSNTIAQQYEDQEAKCTSDFYLQMLKDYQKSKILI